jgi:hypothetical protein
MLSSRWVRDFGLWLRPDLYDDLRPVPQDTAKELEATRALELSRCGYVALYNGTAREQARENWTKWGRDRIEPVIDWVDQAIFSALARLPSAPSAHDCVRVLKGEAATSALIDLPIPEWSRFPHVETAVLHGRISELARGSALEERDGRLRFRKAARWER